MKNLLSLALIALFALACDRPDAPTYKVDIKTDLSRYSFHDSITVTIQNREDITIYLAECTATGQLMFNLKTKTEIGYQSAFETPCTITGTADFNKILVIPNSVKTYKIPVVDLNLPTSPSGIYQLTLTAYGDTINFRQLEIQNRLSNLFEIR